MATKNKRFHLAAIIVAALGVSACDTGPEDSNAFGGSGGINFGVTATDETRSATGITGWNVTPVDDNTLSVVAMGEANDQVANVVIRSTDTEISIEISGDANGRIKMTPEGELIENTIDDTTILARFHEDGLLELDAAGFRASGAECATGAAGAGLDCGQLLLKKNPMQLLKCGTSVVGAGLTCYEWWKGDGNQNGQDGGGQDGGGQDGGDQDGGGQDDGGMDGGGYDDDGGMDGGGYDDGGGMDGGGYDDGGGMDGGGYDDGGGMDGGYGESGGGMDGGYGESGGGMDGGYGEGGYGEGGYGEGGYGEGGYGGDGGYGGYGGEGGYGGGGGYGYGYAPRSRQQVAPTPSATPIPVEGSLFTFSSGGAADGPVPMSAWNLTGGKRKRAN